MAACMVGVLFDLAGADGRMKNGRVSQLGR
jgi:hypothetical protein